jgi:LPXTG-motif cell wall-anchored protein
MKSDRKRKPTAPKKRVESAIFEKSSEIPPPPETQTPSDDTFADIPNTGDSSNKSFLSALMLLSGVGILSMVLNSKKRQYGLEKK